MLRKTLRYLLFPVLVFPAVCLAQYVPVSGTKVLDLGGSPLAAGQICFAPPSAGGGLAGFHVSGGGIALPRQKCFPVSQGSFSGQLADTAITSPPNICISATVIIPGFPNSTSYVVASCLQPSATITTANSNWCTASGCDLDNYVPNGVITMGPVAPSYIGGAFTAAGAITAPNFHGLADSSVTSQQWTSVRQGCPAGYSPSTTDILGNFLQCNANSYQASGTTPGMIAQNPAGNQMITLASGAHQRFGVPAAYLDIDSAGDAITPGIVSSSEVNGVANLMTCGSSIKPAGCPTSGEQSISGWLPFTKTLLPTRTLSNAATVSIGTISLPPGTYTIASPIQLDRFSRLDCNGSTILKTTPGAAVVIADTLSIQPTDFALSAIANCNFVNNAGKVENNTVTSVQVASNVATVTASSAFTNISAGNVVVFRKFTAGGDSSINENRGVVQTVSGSTLTVALPGVANTALITESNAVIDREEACIYVGGDPSGTNSPSAAFGNFFQAANVSCYGFNEGLTIGNNNWGWLISNSQFNSNRIGIFDPHEPIASRVNQGEEAMFDAVRLYDGEEGIVSDTGVELRFNNSFCDYNLSCFDGFDLDVNWTNGHVEQSSAPLVTEWGGFQGHIGIFGGSLSTTLTTGTDPYLFFVAGTGGGVTVRDARYDTNHVVTAWMNNSTSNGACLRLDSVYTKVGAQPSTFTTFSGNGTCVNSFGDANYLGWRSKQFSNLSTGANHVVDLLQPNLSANNTTSNAIAGVDASNALNSLEAFFSLVSSGSTSNTGGIRLHGDTVNALTFVPGGNLTFGNNTTTQLLHVANHFGGFGTQPTVAAGAAAGSSPTGPTLDAHAHDTSGTITVTTGASSLATNASVFVLTFGTPWVTTPHCAYSALNAAAASASTTIFETVSTNAFQLNTNTTIPLTASTQYSWAYSCQQ